MSRLDEIKGRYMQHEYDFALSSADIDYLIQQAEVSKEWQIVANNTYADLIKAERRVKELEDKTDSMARVIKVKNKEMRELSNFLKKRNIPLKELSSLITVMAHVDFLEKALETNAKIAEYATEEKEELKQENHRYKQALEEILGLDIDVSIYDYSGDVITIAAEALKGDKP